MIRDATPVSRESSYMSNSMSTTKGGEMDKVVHRTGRLLASGAHVTPEGWDKPGPFLGNNDRNFKRPSINTDLFENNHDQLKPSPLSDVHVQSPKTIQTSPCNSTMTTDLFSLPPSALTILDWDDTLFPSTWLVETGLELLESCPPHRRDILGPMMGLSHMMLELLQTAKQHSHVVILTNASAGWVHDAVRNFMPNPELLHEINNTQIVYAREEFARIVPDDEFFARMVDDDTPYPMSWKKVAMDRTIREFYGQEHSWKNIVSIGDSPLDRWALDDVVLAHSNPVSRRTGVNRPLRCKTVKVIENPSIQQVQVQVMLLTRYIDGLVASDGSFEFDVAFNENIVEPTQWNPAGKKQVDCRHMIFEQDPMKWFNWTQQNPGSVNQLFEGFETMFDPRCVGDLNKIAQATPSRSQGYARGPNLPPVYQTPPPPPPAPGPADTVNPMPPQRPSSGSSRPTPPHTPPPPGQFMQRKPY